MLSSCLANAAPDAGEALRDVESRRLNLPAPVELDAERPAPRTAYHGCRRGRPDGAGQALPTQRQQAVRRSMPAGAPARPAGPGTQSEPIARRRRPHRRFLSGKRDMCWRALPPGTEIQDGTVRIEVLEGRYGRIELHNTSRTLDRVLLRPLSALERDTAVQGSELGACASAPERHSGLPGQRHPAAGPGAGNHGLAVSRPAPARWSAAGWRQTTMAAATWGISPGNHPRLQQPACDWATRRD